MTERAVLVTEYPAPARKGLAVSYISFEDVTKEYRMGSVSVLAADKVSFEIEKGELCVVLGPSGAGKTTVLNLLGGMDKVTSAVRLGIRL